MASMAAKIVAQYMESQGLTVHAVEGRDDILRAGFSFEGGNMMIFLHFDQEDKHVHLEGLDFIKVPENKYDAMYKVLNQCNDKYVHVKFVLDTDEGQIYARDDDLITLDSCGPECMELAVRMVQIVADAYPIFMKALWA